MINPILISVESMFSLYEKSSQVYTSGRIDWLQIHPTPLSVLCLCKIVSRIETARRMLSVLLLNEMLYRECIVSTKIQDRYISFVVSHELVHETEYLQE